MKIDLHVHSRYSTRPSQWVLQKLGCQECYTQPQTLYRIAQKRGMSWVTITDHNTIHGCLEIAALPHVRDTQFDLNNWVVVASGNSWQITTKAKKSAPTRAAALSGSSDDSTVVIDKAEKLTDVLDDLGADSKKEEDDGPTHPK